jgi:hypothetical protein
MQRDSRRTGWCAALAIVGKPHVRETEGGRGLLQQQFTEVIITNYSNHREHIDISAMEKELDLFM